MAEIYWDPDWPGQPEKKKRKWGLKRWSTAPAWPRALHAIKKYNETGDEGWIKPFGIKLKRPPEYYSTVTYLRLVDFDIPDEFIRPT